MGATQAGTTGLPLRCRLLGHRFRFAATGELMRWTCQRGCGAGGSKRYPTAEAAARYASALDHEDREDLGRRAPLVAGLPLRIARAVRGRHR
jgi:hypothetical protein